MAYEMNDLKGLLILVLLSIPAITSTNIACRGKAFHCVNSTHFMICVDLGGGVSTTIDDFVIPCPPSTVCHENNSFECEFPSIEVTTPAVHVIGVSKQSDISETTSVINSETTEKPLYVISSVKQNTKENTSLRAEEVTSAPKWEFLESLKQPIGIQNESSSDATIIMQVSSNSSNSENNIVNVEQVNNNQKENSILIADDKNLESAVESSIDKAVTASLTDKYKSIDIATTANGLIDLMNNNSETDGNTTTAYELTFLNKIATTAMINSENITGKITKPKENVFTDKTYVTDEINNTTPVVFTTIQSFNQDDINKQIHNIRKNDTGNQTFVSVKPELVGEISTTKLSEIYTTQFVPNKTVMMEPVTMSVSPQSTTGKPFAQTNVENITVSSPSETILTTQSTNSYQIDKINTTILTYNNIATENPALLHNISVTKSFLENVTESTSFSIPVINKPAKFYSTIGISRNESNTLLRTENIMHKPTVMPIIDDAHVNVKPDFHNMTLQLNIFTNGSTDFTIDEATGNTSNNYNISNGSADEIVTNKNYTTNIIIANNNIVVDNLDIVQYASIKDIGTNQTMGSILIPNTTKEFVITLNESSTAAKVKEPEHNLSVMPITVDVYVQNQIDPFIKNIIAPNHITIKSNKTIENSTLLSVISTNGSSDITAEITTRDTSENVTNNQENKNQDTFKQHGLDKLSVDKTAEAILDLNVTSAFWDNNEQIVTKPIPRDIYVQTTSIKPFILSFNNLRDDVNSNNDKNNSTIDLDKGISLSKQTTPQPFSTKNDTEFTTNALETFNVTIISIDAPNQFENIPAIAENITLMTGHQVENNTTSSLDLTHKTKLNTIGQAPETLENILEIGENVTSITDHKIKNNTTTLLNVTLDKMLVTKDPIITTILLQEKVPVTDTFINTDLLKNVNIDHTATESGNDRISSMSTEKYTDIFISKLEDPEKTETIIPEIAVGQYDAVNTSTSKSSISDNNVANISTDTYAVNAHKNDNVKIKQILEINNPLEILPGVISTLTSSHTELLINATENNITSPPILEDYVETTASYTGMHAYTTKTSIPVTNLQVPKTSETSIARTESFKETVRTESVKDISSTSTPFTSINKFDFMNPPNTGTEYMLSTGKLKQGVIAKSSELPNVKSEDITPGSSNKNNINEKLFTNTVSPYSLKTSVVTPNTEESMMTITTAPITSATPVTPSPIKNQSLTSYFEELAMGTTEIIETQTIYQGIQQSTISTTTTAPQIIFEPKFSILPETTLAPTYNTDIDVLNKTTTKQQPLHYMSTQLFNDVTPQTASINSVTEPTSVVKTIKTNVKNISDIIFREIMLNNKTINDTNYSNNSRENAANHVVKGIVSQNFAKSKNTSEKSVDSENVHLETANDTMQVVSIMAYKENKIPAVSTTNSPILISYIELQNKKVIDEIRPNDVTTAKLESVPTAVTTSTFDMITTGSWTTERPKVITDVNVTNNSLNTNIEVPDMIQKPPVTNSIFTSLNNNNINGVKSNSTKTTLTLNQISVHNNTFSNKSQHQPKITNHTTLPEKRTQLNMTGSQINTNEPKLNKTNVNNSYNTTGKTKLNTGNASLFDCTNYTRGKYADTNDCRKFYTCVGNLQPIVGICPNNTVFSEINKQCTRNLSHCVRNNQFRCLLEGRFSDFFKDNIYYICVKNSQNHFVRYKLLCQNNYHLDKATVKCVKNVERPNLSASSVSENLKVINDESESRMTVEQSTKATNIYDFQCEDEGQYAHTNDCRKYYVCTKTSKGIYRRKIKLCSSEEVYDKQKKECVERDSCES